MMALIQGTYYVISGIWPVLNMASFEKVSGAKTDKWLVKTVGALIVAVGITLLNGGDELKLLGITSAFVLGASAAIYSLKGTISKVYLLEAAAELLIILGWIFL